MKFDNAAKVQEVVWHMREIERVRGENRAVLQRQFNGDPPFDEETAEQNNIEINRNFLKGVQVLADARRQWNQAFLSTEHFFKVKLDSGPVHKRDSWASIITKHLNKCLKKSRGMIEQCRGTGANVMLHGIGPVTWKDRHNPIPVLLPLDSVLVPTDTEVDFDNLSRFALYREYTPAQLVELISGPKNPGWNMPLAKALLRRKMTQDSKDLTGYAELSPERLEEVIKQDAGFWDSDAVPTIDVLDFYFREGEDGEGWYRRMVLDWDSESTAQSERPPARNWGGSKEEDPDQSFLYTSGKRPYAKHLSEILHCQFGDCSAYAPFKYHSVRSLGWLLWGVCDLLNRLECKFFESVFENLMWFFRVAGENDLTRIRKANFHHMGVIPNGVNFVSAQDRFVPNPTIVEQARMSLRSHIAETAASYTHDFDKGETQKELTATETMARVNSINALLAGMMTLAYTYEEFKYSEICRRFSKGDHAKAKKFRKDCMKEGVPQEFLDSERWDAQAERVIGAGNKTVEMAAVTFLQQIRKNLGPQAQRKVDHISIRAVTDQPDLANDLAPLDEQQVSNSTHDAELASERLLRGLPFSITPRMVFEDYVVVWLKDLAMTVQKAIAMQSATPEMIAGMQNMAQHIGLLLQQMGNNEDDKPKVKQYADALGQIMNHVKALEQQVREKMQAQGGNGEDAETAAKIKSQMIQAQSKAEINRVSHAQKTAQRQVQFEMEEQRKDRATEAEIQREDARTASAIRAEQIKAAAKAAQTEKETPSEE